MRRSAKVDGNQAEIVAALRKAGAHVQSLASVGKGCPDLLVSHRGKWHAMEIKDPAKPPSARKLTEDQVAWHAQARAPVHVAMTAEEALRALTADEDDWR
jgi:hypothetical protein